MGFKPPLSPVGQVVDVTHVGSKQREYIGREQGWLTPDDVRRAEGLPSPPPPNETMTEGRSLSNGVPTYAEYLGQPRYCDIATPKPLPWPRIWYYAWRLAAMLAWAGGVWAFAELTK